METESGSVVPGAGVGASVSGGRCQRQRLCNMYKVRCSMPPSWVLTNGTFYVT